MGRFNPNQRILRRKRNPSKIHRGTLYPVHVINLRDETRRVLFSATLCAELLYVCVCVCEGCGQSAESGKASIIRNHHTATCSESSRRRRRRRKKNQEGSASDMKTAANPSPVFATELCTCRWLCSALCGSTLTRARAHTTAVWSKHTGGGREEDGRDTGSLDLKLNLLELPLLLKQTTCHLMTQGVISSALNLFSRGRVLCLSRKI